MSHKPEIIEILNSSSEPVRDIDSYISIQIRKIETWWAVCCILLSIMWLSFMFGNRTTAQDKLNYAKPLVDSMKVKYQARVDFIIDSLENNSNQKFK